MSAYKPQKMPLENGVIDVNAFQAELDKASEAVKKYSRANKATEQSADALYSALQSQRAHSSIARVPTAGGSASASNLSSEDINEVTSSLMAAVIGMKKLKQGKFTNELILQLHKELLSDSKRSLTATIGKYRSSQNYIGKGITAPVYTPPEPQYVPQLMDNLIGYMNNPCDNLSPLVRAAIIHAQFETIHPFVDGNGRVGKTLIPLYLYSQKLIPAPFLFINEALETDKHLYHKLLMDMRSDGKWNEWIRFFLGAIILQCDKNAELMKNANSLR